MEIHTKTGIYPYTVDKCLYQGENLISQEEIKIESKYQFDALLEEVKQYNSDSPNKDEGKYLRIQMFNKLNFK